MQKTKLLIFNRKSAALFFVLFSFKFLIQYIFYLLIVDSDICSTGVSGAGAPETNDKQTAINETMTNPIVTLFNLIQFPLSIFLKIIKNQKNSFGFKVKKPQKQAPVRQILLLPVKSITKIEKSSKEFFAVKSGS